MNNALLAPGRYLVQLIQEVGDKENRLLTPLTVVPGESISVTHANVLAAAAYQQGEPENLTLMHPAFESTSGCFVYPDDLDSAPLPADMIPPMYFAYLDDNMLKASALDDYRAKVDAFLTMIDEHLAC